MTKQSDEMFLAQFYRTSYSTLPEFINLSRKDKVIHIKKELIKDWFETHHGEINARPLKEISRQLGFDNYGNAVNFRHIVTLLVVEDYYPIVANDKGYFKANTVPEVDQKIYSEESRIQGIQKRINALKIIRHKLVEREKPIPFEVAERSETNDIK